jgi:ribosomal protein S18 acetylase RimI-like enzyme
MSTPFDDIEYRTLKADDGPLLAQLLMQERISLGGRVDPALYRAFIEDALGGRGPHIMVAKAGGRIVGWSIGVINSRCYWMSFVGSRPGIGVKILIRLFFQRFRNRKRVNREFSCGGKIESTIEALPKARDGKWGKMEPDTVRITDITVLPSYRGVGVGGKLQVHHLRTLKSLGVRRAEAYVQTGKSGWLLFYSRIGFKIAGKKGNSLLVANDLEESFGDDT